MVTKYNIKVQYAAWMAVATIGTVIVLTLIGVTRELNSRAAQAQARAETLARKLAEVTYPGVRLDQRPTVSQAVGMVPLDEEVLWIRVQNADGRSLLDTAEGKQLTDALVVTAMIGPESARVGKVEVAWSQANSLGGALRTMGINLVVGVVLVAGFVALSFIASAPVRSALQDLEAFVQKLARGQSRGEQMQSDLTEVDRVGRTLSEVVLRVEEGQAKLAKSQRSLKAAQKEMDEYTYVISHDLKEPLRGIEAFSKFLSDGYREKLDDNGRHYVDTIRNSTLRMQRLIGDLLKFSRLAQQKNPMTPVGLNSMLVHVRLNLQYALDQKKAELHVNRLPTIVCDATAMTEVFHNLISNAIKYNDKPSPVVEVGCAEKPNLDTGFIEYEFYVRDNGLGIKKEYFDKIFQIFQRLQRDEEGTGIGLTIVRRVVEWHGGRVWLESAENEGTTFYFTIPKREATKSGTIMELPKTAPKEGAPVA